MANINPTGQQVYALIQKYFPQSEWENAYKVASGESGGFTNFQNDANPSQERSYGPFQVNINAHPQYSKAEMLDPEMNVRYAAQLWQEQGWQPWTVARNMGLPGTTPVNGGSTMAEPTDEIGSAEGLDYGEDTGATTAANDAVNVAYAEVQRLQALLAQDPAQASLYQPDLTKAVANYTKAVDDANRLAGQRDQQFYAGESAKTRQATAKENDLDRILKTQQGGLDRATQEYIAQLSNEVQKGNLQLSAATNAFDQAMQNYTFRNTRQQMAGGLYNNANDLVGKYAPMAAYEGQKYFSGMGPEKGGILDQLGKLLGANIDAVPINRIAFNPRGDVERVLQGGYDWAPIAQTVQATYGIPTPGGGPAPNTSTATTPTGPSGTPYQSTAQDPYGNSAGMANIPTPQSPYDNSAGMASPNYQNQPDPYGNSAGMVAPNYQNQQDLYGNSAGMATTPLPLPTPQPPGIRTALDEASARAGIGDNWTLANWLKEIAAPTPRTTVGW
jgi:hypothetical protein